MLDVTLEDSTDDLRPADLTDIVVPAGGDAFPPFRPSADVETSAIEEKGWRFADSFELAMLAVCLAGASFLAANLLGADRIGASLVSEPAGRLVHAVLSWLACLFILAGLVFTVEGLLRLRALNRYLDQADPITLREDATPGCADGAPPGARTGKFPARSRA